MSACSLGYLGYRVHPVAPIAVAVQYATPEEADPYVRFDMEAYDSIQKNYWQKGSDADMAKLFALSVQKAASGTTTPNVSDRAGTAKMIAAALASKSDDAKKEFALNTVIVALYNLPPAGRNGILSNKQEQVLRQEVSNVNPAKDLYADVGAQKGASVAEVKSAFVEKKQQLEKATSTDAKQQLAQATYAYDVLTKDDTKTRYDTAKVEPTIFVHTLGSTLYLYISQMAPTTYDEFVATINTAQSNRSLDSMIIDLRGNIGGALDIAPAIIGLFLGQNQYTFDLYSQGDYTPVRSPVPRLDALKRYRDIAILTDGMTQSTSEVIASSLKRLNIAHTVGQTTRGWGTVENTFPLSSSIEASTTYALLLVHGVTLRDDNQPIEGRGVDADVNTTDPNWKSQLPTYFRSLSIITALQQEAKKPPLKD